MAKVKQENTEVNVSNINDMDVNNSNVSDYTDDMEKQKSGKIEKVNLDDDKNIKLKLTDDELLDQMRKRYSEASSAFRDQREEAKEDFEFIEGKQFTDREEQARKNQGRPAKVYNKMQQFLNNVVNQIVMNMPSINVKRSDFAGNNDTTLAFQSIIKSEEYRSSANIQYNVAVNNACSCGEGYLRVYPEYESPMSFDQRIRIEAIEDIFNVLIDPNVNPSLDNMEYAFISSYMTKEEYCATYPDSDLKRVGDFGFASEYEDNDWVSRDLVRVTEYFYFEYETDKVYMLDNGTVVRRKDYKKSKDIYGEISREKTETFRSVKWIKTNGYEILEKRDFVGDYIPVVPVFGQHHRRNGKLKIKSVIRDAKTSQQEHNYMKNTALELIAMSPKAPWIGQEGVFEGHEEEWAAANFINVPYLEYKATNAGGQASQPPVRTQFDTNFDSVIGAIQLSENDFKSTTGIYDPSLGAKSNEISGVAIMSKQQQTELITSAFSNNFIKSLSLLGKVILKMIPSVYSVSKKVKLYDDNNNRNNSDKFIDLSNINIDFSQGSYDVEVAIAPYGETQRQEAFNSIMSLVSGNPQMLTSIGDLLFENLDFKGSDELAKRFKKMVPPELLDEGDENPISPQAQQIINELQQQILAERSGSQTQLGSMEQAINKLTQMNNENQNRITSRLDEIASKERINSENNLVKILLEQLKNQSAPNGLLNEKSRLMEAQDSVVPVTFANKDETIVDHVNDPITIANNAQAAQDQLDSETAAQQVQQQDNDFSDEDLGSLLEGSESYLNDTKVNRRQ